VSQPWNTPAPVVELSSPSIETTTRVSLDGLAIMFSSNRGGDADLYYSTRGSRSEVWSTPVRVAELSMAAVGDYGAFLSPGLLQVMFCRGATVADEALYTSKRASATGTWDPPAIVAELNDGTHSECDPMLPNGRVLFYSSNVTGDYDIYEATRTTGPWSAGDRQIGVNVPGFEDRDPWVSQDGHTMIYSSTFNDGIERLYVSQR
jgi:hypothetical protein